MLIQFILFYLCTPSSTLFFQRKQYKLWSEGKQTMINEERVAALEKLGFSWSLRVSYCPHIVHSQKGISYKKSGESK
jgi:hypothetical protein